MIGIARGDRQGGVGWGAVRYGEEESCMQKFGGET